MIAPTDQAGGQMTVVTTTIDTAPESVPTSRLERRVVALDGLRGLMTIAVIISHYFGELQHGLPIKVGWIAVDMFFVLSGFLIGKLILEKQVHANFFKVFYVRRFCRIVPAYIITILTVSVILHFVPQTWLDTTRRFPLWAYLTFNQPFFMIATQSIGSHWLAPTWTLAFEEHFYLLAPGMIVFCLGAGWFRRC